MSEGNWPVCHLVWADTLQLVELFASYCTAKMVVRHGKATGAVGTGQTRALANRKPQSGSGSTQILHCMCWLFFGGSVNLSMFWASTRAHMADPLTLLHTSQAMCLGPKYGLTLVWLCLFLCLGVNGNLTLDEKPQTSLHQSSMKHSLPVMQHRLHGLRQHAPIRHGCRRCDAWRCRHAQRAPKADVQ